MSSTSLHASGAQIEICRGPLAAERHVLDLVGELRAEALADPARLATPLRIIVPSRSLRMHLSERIVARFGAVLGLTIQTLHTLAIELLDRGAQPATGGDALVDLLIRRQARNEAVLRRECDGFVDGLRSAIAPVRDLLDAGFEPELADALLERLDEAPVPHPQRKRAQALVSTAAAVGRELEARGAGGRAELLRRAREAFETSTDTLPTRLLIVHGFADATGRATDLLEALARRLPTRFVFDHPADPDAPDDLERVDLGVAFTARLLERLSGTASAAAGDDAPTEAPHSSPPILFVAPGASAEAREVAVRVRALLDAGVVPERIGIIARDLTSYRSPLRAQLERLGVPFSAWRTTGTLDASARRVHALVDLLRSAERAPCDRWLDATARLSSERNGGQAWPASADLRLGLRVVGAGQLGDAATLKPDEFLSERDRLRLPVRRGAFIPDEDIASGRDRRSGSFLLSRRSLHGDDLRGALQAARGTLRRLERWPQRASVERHLQELERLRHRELGWRPKDDAERRIQVALTRLGEALAGETLSREEFLLVAERAVLPASFPPLGGAGAGVQVLDAMEARARTFEHVFVLGLNQGIFPRVHNEDPLLPDDVRRRLLDVLPDLPIKARARSEERYLFAQLLASSEHVTVSWQSNDDDGKARVISPLVERLLREEDIRSVPAAPALPRRTNDGGERQSAHEHAILAGLAGARVGAEFADRLQFALGESGLASTADDGASSARALAQSRARVLDAYESSRAHPERLAPWLGFLGAQDHIRPDPRVEPLWVTRVEAMIRCPWQAALGKLLRLEDAPDPLERLPGIEPLSLGNIVHAVLQRIDEESLGSEPVDLAVVAKREPSRAPWPTGERFEALLIECARSEARKKHAPLPGLVRMLAECARPYVESARAFFASEAPAGGERGVVGVEVTGVARIARGADETLELVFRADRVDRHGDTLVLTDYKTGAAITTKELKKSGIPSGANLQAMAYILAALEHAPAAVGRYLYLGATEDSKGDLQVAIGDEYAEHVPDFANAVSTAIDAWTTGTFFPRLIDAAAEKEPNACRTCDVREACVIGDSGARRALTEWTHGDAPRGNERDALRKLFELSAATHAPKKKGGA